MLAWLAAASLLAVLPITALAVSWGTEVQISDETSYDRELVRSGPDSAVAAWFEFPSNIVVRRTGDRGYAWSELRFRHASSRFGLAARGARVDIAYPRNSACLDGSTRRVYYRRSTDGGSTWTLPLTLSPRCTRITDAEVAHGPNGQVTVVWTVSDTGQIKARTSWDHGATFGRPVVVATTTSNWSDTSTGPGIHHSEPELAIGSGVTYLAFSPTYSQVAITRSTDGGASWSTPRVLSKKRLGEDYSLVASGRRAIVGYRHDADGTSKGVYRRTLDSGATWSSPRVLLGGPAPNFSEEPIFAYHEGRLAAIATYGTRGDTPVWHRESRDFGATWSQRSRVSVAHDARHTPRALGIAILDDRQLALYDDNEPAYHRLFVRQSDSP